MTIPYTTGSVTLTNNSAAVVGVGTGWATALIAGGVLYPEADGNAVPILSVTDDTHLTLATKWKGASGSYPYAIIRDSALTQQIVANTNALATLLNNLSDDAIAALAALVPVVGTFPYFNGPASAALATLSDFMRTLLDDPDQATARATLGANNASNINAGTLADGRLPAFMTGKTFNGNIVQNSGEIFSYNDGNRALHFRTAAGLEQGLLYSEAGNRYLHLITYTAAGAPANEFIVPPTGSAMLNGLAVWTDGNAPVLKSGNGYQKLPNGIIIQWGYDGSGSDPTITFPIAFTSLVRVVANLDWGASSTQLFSAACTSTTTTTFVMKKRYVEGGVVAPINAGAIWLAIGY